MVFGPIRSRRLGISLGVNLLPENGKLCNFDCIYCECGWNADGKADKSIPSRARVRSALEDKLCNMMLEEAKLDSITFSGDGEPTLNPDFPGIIEDTLRLRDIYYPKAKVSVLSNATRLSDPKVVEALKKVDNPILKLDAATDAFLAKINRPAPGCSVSKIMEGMEQFEGNFILQTIFLKSAEFDSSMPMALEAWMSLVRYLRPREVMVYTIDRPTPMEGLQKFTKEEMTQMVKPLMDEGFDIQIRG